MDADKSGQSEVSQLAHTDGGKQKLNGGKIFKFICFIIYTYCIYQSYVFSIAIVELVIKWDRLSWWLVKEGLMLFFSVPIIIFQGAFHPEFYLLMLLFASFYAPIFILWWLCQSIYTAFLVALTGQYVGPGLILLLNSARSEFRYPGVEMGMEGVWIFYFSLLIAHLVQKKFFPENKYARRIRNILAWPCLRTSSVIRYGK